jgi:hypothetical protein
MNNRIKFRHYRAIAIEGGDEGGAHSIDPRGGATLAYTTDNVGDVPHCVGSIAYCNPSDNYRKNYGRCKSQGRLQQNAQSGYTLTDHDKHFAFDTDDEKAFLSLMDEHMRDYGYMPR